MSLKEQFSICIGQIDFDTPESKGVAHDFLMMVRGDSFEEGENMRPYVLKELHPFKAKAGDWLHVVETKTSRPLSGAVVVISGTKVEIEKHWKKALEAAEAINTVKEPYVGNFHLSEQGRSNCQDVVATILEHISLDLAEEFYDLESLGNIDRIRNAIKRGVEIEQEANEYDTWFQNVLANGGSLEKA